MLALAGTATAQPSTFRIPFREVNHRILVDVNVDGRPATLFFDTGARVSVWYHRTADDLKTCRLRVARSGNFVCDGDAPDVGFVRPENEVHFDGFLGADVLSKFSSVLIDYKNRMIILSE